MIFSYTFVIKFSKVVCPLSIILTDDKPLVVVTHGDLLSRIDRARIRVHLGELLGIPPTKQIFDIPGHSQSVDYFPQRYPLCFLLYGVIILSLCAYRKF